MKINSINSEEEYQQALKRLEVIFDAEPNSPEGDELEILGRLIDEFEKENFHIED